MAVIIDTSTMYAGLFGLDPYGIPMDGFTSGNLAGGVQPTQLSAAWFNSVQQEINNAIIPGVSFALDNTDYSQLGFSIDNQIIARYPRTQTGVTYTFRSQADSEITGSAAQNSLRRERTAFSSGLSSGTTTTVLSMPTVSNSQVLLHFELNSVQTDTITNYGNARLTVSARNAAGVVTIQNTSTDYIDAPLGGWSVAVSTSGTFITLRVSIPAAPAGKTHHVFAYGSAINVVRT